MRQAKRDMQNNNLRRGTTLFEILIVLGLVAILASATAVYNRGIGQQIALTREHAMVLGLFIRARSAGLTIPQGNPGEIVCGYGVHIDTASRTLVYFKDLGVSDCTITDHAYIAGADGIIEQRTLSNTVTLAGSASDIVYVPPFGKVYIDGSDAQAPAIITVTNIITNASKRVKVNAFGQVTEATSTTP